MKLYKDAAVKVLSTNGGWSTVQSTDGKTFKVRNGQLTEAPVVVAASNGLIHANLSNYVVTREIRTPSGRSSVDCGDGLSELLRGKTLDEVYKFVAEFLGVSEESLRTKYSKLNAGMQRMNLGNRCRRSQVPACEKYGITDAVLDTFCKEGRADIRVSPKK
jgi:hypothetical protein